MWWHSIVNLSYLINNLPLWHECQKHLTDHSWSKSCVSILYSICKISKRYYKPQYILWLPLSWLCLVMSWVLMFCAIVLDVICFWLVMYLWPKGGPKFGKPVPVISFSLSPSIYLYLPFLQNIYYISPFLTLMAKDPKL